MLRAAESREIRLPSIRSNCRLPSLSSLRALLGDAADARDAFPESLHRGRVGDSYEALRAEARAVCDDRLRLFEQEVCELCGGLQASAEAAAPFGEDVARAFGFVAA